MESEEVEVKKTTNNTKLIIGCGCLVILALAALVLLFSTGLIIVFFSEDSAPLPFIYSVI